MVNVKVRVPVEIVVHLERHDGRNVRVAHDAQAQRLDAVVDVHASQHGVLLLDARVQLAPGFIVELQRPCILAYNVLRRG